MEFFAAAEHHSRVLALFTAGRCSAAAPLEELSSLQQDLPRCFSGRGYAGGGGRSSRPRPRSAARALSAAPQPRPGGGSCPARASPRPPAPSGFSTAEAPKASKMPLGCFIPGENRGLFVFISCKFYRVASASRSKGLDERRGGWGVALCFVSMNTHRQARTCTASVFVLSKRAAAQDTLGSAAERMPLTPKPLLKRKGSPAQPTMANSSVRLSVKLWEIMLQGGFEAALYQLREMSIWRRHLNLFLQACFPQKLS